MPEKENNLEGQETKEDAQRFPEWVTQMMSACGPAMEEQMGNCCSGIQSFAGCCGSHPDRNPGEKA